MSRMDGDLTATEVRVLRALDRHPTARAGADELGMPYSTLRKHVEHILAKLDLHSSRQAVLWAERHGMLSREER